MADQGRFKRKQNGRSSRRRKAKLRAILQVEQSLLTQQQKDVSESTDKATAILGSSPPSTIERTSQAQVPTDRDRIWPGVLHHRQIDLSDQSLLMGQLGYLPGNALRVVARSRDVPELSMKDEHAPLALQLYPIAIREAYGGGKVDGRKFKFKSRKRGPSKEPKVAVNNTDAAIDNATAATKSLSNQENIEPFPTMYWLTHPILRTLTSKLELGDTHNARVLEKRLLSNKDALARMKRAHHEYGTQRHDLLVPEDLELIKQRNWEQAFAIERGVAGIRKPFAIKCLHAHLAHYLSGCRDNVVGQWVLDEIIRMLKEAKKSGDQEEQNQLEESMC